MTTRREILGYGATLSLAAVLGPRRVFSAEAADELAKRAVDAGQTQVVIAGGTGGYLEKVKKYYLDPFTKATGIEVVSAGASYGEKIAKLKAMVEVGNVEWDVMTLSIDALTTQNRVYFRDLGRECQETPMVAKAGIDGACLQKAVLFDIGGVVLAYNTENFPSSGPQPATWKDFWDVAKFPGPRALPNVGNPWWNLIAALLADGVAPAELFPLDLDRAFKKLDEIKPHISVWWSSGDQNEQIFRSGEVVMMMTYRQDSLKEAGQPIGISWKGAIRDASGWGVLKDARRPLAGLALLNYMYSHPENDAGYINEYHGSAATGNKEALALLDPAVVAALPTAPQFWSETVRVDPDWLDEHTQELLSRWSTWLSQ
ncbi:extracellular solute-binding protein [Mesorhizobium sp. M0816]|uniref:extracellular solute-binding protein n=1 Tax=Mesorhizobium sp. M0816 TaxID=2957006 RepID=UPI003335D39D